MHVEMEGKKPYMIAIVIQLIYTGLVVVTKAAFDEGMNTFVYIFYRQAASSLLLMPIAFFLERKNAPPVSFWLLLKLFLYSLIGNTFSLNLYSVSVKYTSATLGSATYNILPVATFCIALLFRREVVKIRCPSGVAKVTGVALCLAGVLVIAFYSGPSLSPINHHRAFAVHASDAPNRVQWIKGTFLMVLANITWSLWIVIQAGLLEEYPNKMLVTLSQCVFSTLQSFLAALVAERDFSRWKLRLDISLLAILYSGFMLNGVSYYLQAWCVQKKGPVFLTVWTPLCLIFTIFCSSFFLGEIVHFGSILGGILMVGGLYSMLWGKIKENKITARNKVIIIDDVHDEHDNKKTRVKEVEQERGRSTTDLDQV
ncbi:hypothetical protein ACP4OV_008953 [Aristida adscensionis]